MNSDPQCRMTDQPPLGRRQWPLDSLCSPVEHRPNLQTVAALIVVQSDGTRDQRQFDGSARRSHRSKVSVRGVGGLAVLLLFLEGRVTGAVGKIVSIAAPVCWHDARVRASPNNELTSSFADPIHRRPQRQYAPSGEGRGGKNLPGVLINESATARASYANQRRRGPAIGHVNGRV